MSAIKELWNDVREMNQKYKCVPLIIFAVIYIASPIDLLPELIYKSWLFYLEDMVVLILTCIITYMEVFLNERIHKDNERIEGVYSAVRRNNMGHGSRRNIDGAGSIDGDDIHGLPSDLFSEEKFNAPPVGAIGADTEPIEPEHFPEPEQFVFEPSGDERANNDTAECFFEQQIIASVSTTDECLRQVSEQSRPDSFIISNGDAIIW